MSSILPFDNAVINGTEIETTDFVNGSGSLTEKGSDTSVTTADNRIHNIRKSISRSADFELYGDQTSLNSAPGLGTSCVLKHGSSEVASFTGIVSASYNSSSLTTSISIAGDSQ
jgi:hypothetical protein